MIIDGHAHACGDFLTSESIIKKMDDAGIDKVILVPGESNSSKSYSLPNFANVFPSKNVMKFTNSIIKFVIKITGKVKQIPNGNEYVYKLCKQSDGRILQFVWITQEIKNPVEYLNTKLSVWKFKGVKLHQCWETFSIDSVFFNSIAKWTEENNIPLFIHLFSDRDVKKIIEYKKKHPKLKLIIAHLFGLELFIDVQFKDSNLYFDSSPLPLISSKRLMNALKFVGAERVLMGTDTPYGINNLRKDLDRIKKLDISKKEKDLILGYNIKKLLKI
jgi:hypothetical protein